jgi:phosphocarrier protein HPr
VADLDERKSVVRREATVVNKQGWHARPAAMVVRCANGFKSEVLLSINGLVANAKSMMDVIMLASPLGSIVQIDVTGPDAEACAEALEALIRSGFGEEIA